MFKLPPKELDLIKIEHDILKFWTTNSIPTKYLAKNSTSSKKWSFQDGPITANNPMGVHHAWGRTYKDIFQRYRTMKGFKQRYQNGFDCQGLWVEVEVERELGFKTKKDIEKYGIDKFVEKCKQRVHKYSKIQTSQSIRLGMWMDWGEWNTKIGEKRWLEKSHSYYTMSEVNNYTIWYFLKKCHERGWIYKGEDVMPWCIRCGTAISNMEIATEGYQEIVHKGLTIKFPIKGKEGEFLLVWTTTPWTLTANTGVAVHPDLSYVKIETPKGKYYLGEKVVERIVTGEFKILQKIKGKDLVGLLYKGPFDYLEVQKEVLHKVIPWEGVTEEEGTGLVHLAPGCGKEDFELSKEFKLKIIAPIDEVGTYKEGFGWITGENVKEIEPKIIEDLKKRGKIYKIENYKHRYPICWRCGEELVFRLVTEWFISMKDLRFEIMEVAKQVEKWIPSYGIDHELDWLKNMGDWCISKKRYWGLALPIWECNNCSHFEVIGGKEELKQKTIKGWEEFENHSPHRPWVDKIKLRCSKCNSEMNRIPDVGTPWLDAGIVPFSTIRKVEDMHKIEKGYPYDKSYWKEWFPADFITECFPGQFRNWFYAILTMSTVLENKPPFKIVLGHALVRDERGEEMHKSKGTAIWFDEAVEKMGADIMRWMFAKQNPTQNLNFNYKTGKEIKKNLLTLWNVYSFFVTYANIDEFQPEGKTVKQAKLNKLDRWILSKLNSLIKKCDQNYENYKLQGVIREVESFFDDLSNWYVRRNRRRFWKGEKDEEKETGYLVLYECLVKLIKIISPITPFLSEEIYQNLTKGKEYESVHLSPFPFPEEEKIDTQLEERMAFVRKIVSMGRAIRNKEKIKVRQPLKEIIVETKEKITKEEEEVILDELNIKKLKIESLEGKFFYEWKPKFEIIGPKWGKNSKEVSEEIKKLTPEEIKKLDKGGRLIKKIKNLTIEITPEEVEVEKKGKNGWCILYEGEVGVALNITLDEELKYEGIIRELVHKIQLVRKEKNFNIVDRIKIYFKADEEIREAVRRYKKYLKEETLAQEVKEEEENWEKEVKIRGGEVKLKVEKI